jgi:hypothetical protein
MQSDFGENHFDRCQFDGREAKKSSKETRLAWSDCDNIGIVSHSGYLGAIPAWATDNEQLKAVICLRDERHAARISNVEQLPAEYLAHDKAVKRAGSYKAWLAGIAYRAWRQGLDSVAIGQEMDMSPVSVRQQLYRMRLAARDLGFDPGYQPSGKIQLRSRQRSCPNARDPKRWRLYRNLVGRGMGRGKARKIAYGIPLEAA